MHRCSTGIQSSAIHRQVDAADIGRRRRAQECHCGAEFGLAYCCPAGISPILLSLLLGSPACLCLDRYHVIPVCMVCKLGSTLLTVDPVKEPNSVARVLAQKRQTAALDGCFTPKPAMGISTRSGYDKVDAIRPKPASFDPEPHSHVRLWLADEVIVECRQNSFRLCADAFCPPAGPLVLFTQDMNTVVLYKTINAFLCRCCRIGKIGYEAVL